MRDLEETHCEVRKVIDLQLPIWDRLNNLGGEESGLPVGSQIYKGSANPLGGFLHDTMYAWISYGPRLVVLNVRTGENIASWTFHDKVTCVSRFPVLCGQVPLLLVGLDNGATRIKDSAGMVCVFDCSTSRILRAIRVPAGVEQVCVVNGGAEWEELTDERTDSILRENCGMAFVVLRNLYHIVIDLRRSLWDGDNSYLILDESCPTEIEFNDSKDIRKHSSSSRHRQYMEKHAACNLLNSRIEQYIRFNREEFEQALLYEDSLTSTVISSRKIGCLISGCLGRVIIWQNDGSVGWVCPPIDENMAVSHLALLEPADDPKPFYYLWVAYQEESSRKPPVLRMYALLFERKYCDKGTNLYFNLEGEPSLKFEFELEEGDRITSLSTIERGSNQEQTESSYKRGEDSLLLIGVDGRTFLFDLNQWYKEQMPRTFSECENPNSIMTSYRTKSRVQGMAEDATLSCTYVPSSLHEFLSNSTNPPEELLYPNSLSLEWLELSMNRLTFWMTRGVQWELLRDMAAAGPAILIQPSEPFHRCLAVGLIPFNTDCSFSSDHNAQREMLLSLCLEQRWSTFLIRCARDWSDGSVAYLYPAFLRWGAQRASMIKITADRLCVPLFDQSGNSISEADVKTLRFCSQQLECLSNVVAKIPTESSDLQKQQRALGRVTTYLQVVLWFYDVGLLPETQDLDEEALPISLTMRIPYPYERLATFYKERRVQMKNKSRRGDELQEDLFIDELITRECSPLRLQWEREGGDASLEGYYPPTSLQSLLRSYLTDCNESLTNEMEHKHQITIYLLMDLAMLLQGSCPGVDRLIKYPSAFKMSPSLIKLTQAFWLLDHQDYQGFLDMMTGQLVSDSDVKDWHHKFIIRTLLHNDQHKLALTYLRVRKPPLSSVNDQSTAITLSVEHGLVHSAFHRRLPSHYAQLLNCFFQSCKSRGILNDILHLALDPEEEEAFVKFLEDNKCEETKLLYYLQRCRYTEASNMHTSGLDRNYLQKTFPSIPLTMLNAYHSTLPEVTRNFSTNVSKRNLVIDPECRYSRPMSHCKSYNRSQGLYETVIKKAKETFVRGDRTQIPFISAPCSSLRMNSCNNTDCVLFPVLARKTYGKRTLDQTREDDDEERNVLEDRKRRKIHDNTDSVDKTDTRELGMSMAFDTPLIQKKRQLNSNKNSSAETPHSILKIRQLIRNSTSPTARIIETSARESEEKESSNEKGRRPTRQIRFSITQPRDDSVCSDLGDMENDIEDQKDEEENPEDVNENKEDTSKESNEVFFSPNISTKSHSESILLTDSSYSGRSIAGPRPRPSLRRSTQLASNESLTDLSKILPRTASPILSKSSLLSSSNTPPITPRGIARARSSLLASSIYASSILSDSSNVDFSPILKLPQSESASPSVDKKQDSIDEKYKMKELSCPVEEEYKNTTGKRLISTSYSKTISVKSSTVTKISTFEEHGARGDDEVLMEVDDFGLDREPEVCFEDSEQFDKRLFGKEPMNVEVQNVSQDSSEVSIKEIVEDKENLSDEQQMQIERKEENNIKPSKKSIVTTSEEQVNSSNEDKEQKSVHNVSEDSEEELIALKDKDKDEDESKEETFQSFSNSLNGSIQNNLKPTDNVSQNYSQEISFNKNSVKEVARSYNENSNITDDESVQSIQDIEPVCQEVNKPVQSIQDIEPVCQEVNKSETGANTASAPASQESKNIYDMSNITDDESDVSLDVIDSVTRRASTKKNDTNDNHNVSTRKYSIRSQRSASVASKLSDDLDNVSDHLEYSEIAHSASPNVTDVLEKLGKTRKQENTLLASVSDDVFLTNDSNKSKLQVSTKVKASAGKNTSSKKSQEPEETKDTESQNDTPARITRSRRSSSVIRKTRAQSESESHPGEVEKSGRSRRASSLAKEVLISSIRTTDESFGKMASSGSESSLDILTPKKGRTRRSSSLAKDVIPSPIPEEAQEEKVEIPLRRSTRRAASVQKEIPTVSKTSTRKSKMSASTSSLDALEESEDEMPKKKGTRGKRESSVSKEADTSLTTRTRRASSLAKETPEELPKNSGKRSTRKRASSVPKDTSILVSRASRASSVAKETIPEESDEDLTEHRTRSSTKIEKDLTSSPAGNTRSRISLSMQSIPEEVDGILSSTSKGKSSTAKAKKKTTQTERERRAASVEPIQTEPKRRTRSILAKSAITEDVIEEEPAEQATVTKKTTTRRKRTTSSTSVKDQGEVEKLKRTRRSSLRSVEGDESFHFSAPDQAFIESDDEQEAVGEVPDYVFSPPHTRSKQLTPTQPQD
ncbi:protein ELYS isoform X2 [Cephus cinctus]|uniref:Protein ELYS isoform X2 n=1 Tax=Cephus cinctus TaxID=211228 RepID=A0AAJ7C3Y4_CEPCN|nr:protein ELYS isoform X2 [Cephus cinctus]